MEGRDGAYRRACAAMVMLAMVIRRCGGAGVNSQIDLRVS